MAIRLATVDDVEAIFDIRTSVRQNHLSRAALAALDITPDTIAAAIMDAPCVWIADVDAMPVAFVMIDQALATVFAMFVHPDFENRGLGRQLMAVAEQALFAQHDVIWLTTDPADHIRANGFYQTLGWVQVGPATNGDVRYEKRVGVR